jgi:hypothetical protein
MTAPQPVPRSTTPAPAATRAPSTGLSRHPAVLVGLVIAVLTLLAATASALWPELGPSRGPRPTLHGTPEEAVSIFVANARTLIAPLLLSAGRWHSQRLTGHIGDLVVAALVTANPVMVGLALGRYPTQLPVYLPHLPLEDAAQAITAAAWLSRRLPSPTGRPALSLRGCAALTFALTAFAAVVETYATPIRQGPP